jgi:hypothetical protein
MESHLKTGNRATHANDVIMACLAPNERAVAKHPSKTFTAAIGHDAAESGGAPKVAPNPGMQCRWRMISCNACKGAETLS